MPMYRSWTEEEENDLIGLVVDGASVNIIQMTLLRPHLVKPRSMLAIKARIGPLYSEGMISVSIGDGMPRY